MDEQIEKIPSVFSRFARLPIPVIVLVAVLCLNWFIWGGVVAVMGGVAVGVIPSEQGFVLASQDLFVAVSERDWVINLVYSTITLNSIYPVFLLALILTVGRNSPISNKLLVVFLASVGGLWWLTILSQTFSTFVDYFDM